MSINWSNRSFIGVRLIVLDRGGSGLGGYMWAGIKSKNSGALLISALFGLLQSFTAHANGGDVSSQSEHATPAGANETGRLAPSSSRSPQSDPPAAAATDAAERRELAPIVITATKRQTTAQSTPISITAVTADEIA